MKNYTVTETAGDFVAGRRSPGAGKSIELTPEQARYPLLNKEIEETVPAPRATRSKKQAPEVAPEVPAA